MVENDLQAAWGLKESAVNDSMGLEMWEVAEQEWEMLEKRGGEMAKWWREHLRGAKITRVTQGEAAMGKVSRSVVREIPSNVEARVKEAGRRVGVSLFAAWQGVFAWWSWRAFGGEREGEKSDDEADVLVVGPYGRRDDERAQRTVGYLVNMVVYRYGKKALVESESLEELARESGRIVAESIERGGSYPFGRLVRECGVEGAGEHLMDVTFDWLTGQDLRGLRAAEERAGNRSQESVQRVERRASDDGGNSAGRRRSETHGSVARTVERGDEFEGTVDEARCGAGSSGGRMGRTCGKQHAENAAASDEAVSGESAAAWGEWQCEQGGWAVHGAKRAAGGAGVWGDGERRSVFAARQSVQQGCGGVSSAGLRCGVVFDGQLAWRRVRVRDGAGEVGWKEDGGFEC